MRHSTHLNNVSTDEGDWILLGGGTGFCLELSLSLSLSLSLWRRHVPDRPNEKQAGKIEDF